MSYIEFRQKPWAGADREFICGHLFADVIFSYVKNLMCNKFFFKNIEKQVPKTSPMV